MLDSQSSCYCYKHDKYFTDGGKIVFCTNGNTMKNARSDIAHGYGLQPPRKLEHTKLASTSSKNLSVQKIITNEKIYLHYFAY